MSQKPWEPRTKAEARMNRRFRGKSSRDRMRYAMRLVSEEDWSQSAAARECGVDRSQLNKRLKADREHQERLEARAQEAKRARVAAFEPEPEPEPVEHAPSAPEGAQELVTEERRLGTFREFNERYFGNEVCPDCNVHHETPDFHLEMMDLLEDQARRLKLINLAPYHAKSTTATMKSTIYELVRDPSSRTALISRATPLAKAFLYQIKQHLTDPDLYNGAAGNLIEDWGPFHNPNHWADDQIYIAGRSGAQKDPSISVYGYGTQIYGRRFDRMIFDDVADLENQNTPEQIQKMYRKMWQEYANRVGKTGQLIWVGTRVMPGDVYSLLDDVEGMNVLRYPAILDEVEKRTLWPDHAPYDFLVTQREAMGEVQFQLVYQNIEMPGTGASFTQEALERSHDVERRLGDYDPRWAIVLGVDPAGANEQAGFTAMVVMGVDLATGRRHLIDLVNHRQMKAPQIIDQIIAFADMYPLREVRVEVNGLQAQLFQYNDQLNSALVSRGVRIAPHVTHKGNKWDPQFGVEAMATLYHNQMISTPWADINTRKKMGELEAQLLAFPVGAVSDLAMAMWFASIGCREVSQRADFSMFDNRKKLPSRIRKQRKVLDFGNRTARAPDYDEEHGTWMGRQIMRPKKPASFVNVER